MTHLPTKRTALVNSDGTSLLCPTIDYVLVDGSGSMSPKWLDSMTALDAYVSEMQRSNLNSQLIVQVFSGLNDIDLLQRDHRLADWVPFMEDPLEAPFQGTFLYSAINAMGLRLRHLSPERCSIVIVTDGDASFIDPISSDQARAILDWCRAQGWAVTFIGCDFNNSKQARLLGADDSNSIGVQQRLLADAGKLLAEKRRRYEHGGDMEFSDSEKQQFGGYLSGPSAK